MILKVVRQRPSHESLLVVARLEVKSMKRILAGFMFVVLAIAISVAAQNSAPASGQQQAPAISVSTRLVIVDVVATDKNGKVVPGLKASDFHVFDNGHEQKIRFFEEHTAPRAAANREIPKLPPNQFTNFPFDPPKDTINLVLFDLLNVPPADQQYARKEMLKTLARLPKGKQIALFTLGNRLQMIQGPSADSEQLIAAAQKLLASSSRELASRGSQNFANTNIQGLANNSGAPSGTVNGIAVGGSPFPVDEQLRDALVREDKFMVENRISTTLRALIAISRMVNGYPGRKNLVWVTAGIPFRMGPNMKTTKYKRLRDEADYLPELERAGTALAEAQLTVYPVDVSGVAVGGMDSSVSGTSFGATAMEYSTALSDQSEAQWNNRVGMDDIAAQTGGRSYYGSNSIADAIDSALENGSKYYTIAYTPDSVKWDGSYHSIDVKAPAGKLAHRKGYVATPEWTPTEKEANQVLASAMQMGMPSSTALLMRAQVLPPDKSNPNVRIDYAVSSRDVQLTPMEKGGSSGTVDFMASVWDAQSKFISSTTQSINVKVPPNATPDQLRAGIPAHQEVSLKPGNYILCIGAMDRASQRVGTVWLSVSVPELNKETKSN
jgi:VWFA-related protein